MRKKHVKLITSTKASLLEQKIEGELRKLEEENYHIEKITTNLSFSGKEGYMILCQIDYWEEVPDSHIYDSGIDFGAGMTVKSPVGDSRNEQPSL